MSDKIPIELFIEPVGDGEYAIVARAGDYVEQLDARTFKTRRYALNRLAKVLGMLTDGYISMIDPDPLRGERPNPIPSRLRTTRPIQLRVTNVSQEASFIEIDSHRTPVPAGSTIIVPVVLERTYAEIVAGPGVEYEGE
jgi:hypothetical protein